MNRPYLLPQHVFSIFLIATLFELGDAGLLLLQFLVVARFLLD